MMATVARGVLDERIHPCLPSCATPGYAGTDPRACFGEAITLESGKTELIPTGVAIHGAHPGLAAPLLPCSGLGHKHGIVLGDRVDRIGLPGAADGELLEWGSTAFELKALERLAQLMLVPVVEASFSEVEDFHERQRGRGGFGSSGRG